MKNPYRLLPYTVCRIRSLGANRQVAARLTQMGILPGMQITFVRRGPMGGPVELATEDGQNLALRADEMRALECDVVAFPLSGRDAGPARTYRVRRLLGNAGYQAKMQARGLRPGVVFRTESEGPPFRLQLLADGLGVVVGRGEADKLQVEPV